MLCDVAADGSCFYRAFFNALCYSPDVVKQCMRRLHCDVSLPLRSMADGGIYRVFDANGEFVEDELVDRVRSEMGRLIRSRRSVFERIFTNYETMEYENLLKVCESLSKQERRAIRCAFASDAPRESYIDDMARAAESRNAFVSESDVRQFLEMMKGCVHVKVYLAGNEIEPPSDSDVILVNVGEHFVFYTAGDSQVVDTSLHLEGRLSGVERGVKNYFCVRDV